MKITVAQLTDALKIMPPDAYVEAYEGESTGLQIKTTDGRFGWIGTSLRADGTVDIEVPE